MTVGKSGQWRRGRSPRSVAPPTTPVPGARSLEGNAFPGSARREGFGVVGSLMIVTLVLAGVGFIMVEQERKSSIVRALVGLDSDTGQGDTGQTERNAARLKALENQTDFVGRLTSRRLKEANQTIGELKDQVASLERSLAETEMQIAQFGPALIEQMARLREDVVRFNSENAPSQLLGRGAALVPISDSSQIFQFGRTGERSFSALPSGIAVDEALPDTLSGTQLSLGARAWPVAVIPAAGCCPIVHDPTNHAELIGILGQESSQLSELVNQTFAQMGVLEAFGAKGPIGALGDLGPLFDSYDTMLGDLGGMIDFASFDFNSIGGLNFPELSGFEGSLGDLSGIANDVAANLGVSPDDLQSFTASELNLNGVDVFGQLSNEGQIALNDIASATGMAPDEVLAVALSGDQTYSGTSSAVGVADRLEAPVGGVTAAVQANTRSFYDMDVILPSASVATGQVAAVEPEAVRTYFRDTFFARKIQGATSAGGVQELRLSVSEKEQAELRTKRRAACLNATEDLYAISMASFEQTRAGAAGIGSLLEQASNQETLRGQTAVATMVNVRIAEEMIASRQLAAVELQFTAACALDERSNRPNNDGFQR